MVRFEPTTKLVELGVVDIGGLIGGLMGGLTGEIIVLFWQLWLIGSNRSHVIHNLLSTLK